MSYSNDLEKENSSFPCCLHRENFYHKVTKIIDKQNCIELADRYSIFENYLKENFLTFELLH